MFNLQATQHLCVVALMLISSAAADEPPCLQACKDQCYIEKKCVDFKKPQNCIDRCDDNCEKKIAAKGCGGSDAPTPSPTKAPVALTGSPTFAPLPGVPACIGPCIRKCEKEKDCKSKKKPAKCTKGCTKKCLKVYRRVGCPTTSPALTPTTSPPYTNPPVLATFACDTLMQSGGMASQDYKVVFTNGGGVYKGTIEIYYQMYRVPDSLEILYEGKTLFTTGGLVSYTRTRLKKIDGTTDHVIVRVKANSGKTRWNIKVGCIDS